MDQPEGESAVSLLLSRRSVRLLAPIIVLSSFSALFVGILELERFFAPALSTAWRHALLTGMAAVVTAGISLAVYAVMRRQQLQLARTATKLTRLLEAYQANPRSAGRFENPHLVSCEDLPSLRRADCTIRTARGERCWQVMALGNPICPDAAPGATGDPPVRARGAAGSRGNGKANWTIRQCQQCAVYRRSCPDELTELGEGINNLFYLLEQGAGQIGRMRDQMLEKQKMAAVGQIAAGVAHEICNPLASISSVVQLLRRRGDCAVHGEQLDVINRHIERISRVVRQLIELTGPVANTWELVELGKIIEEAVDVLKLTPQARGVEVKVVVPEHLPAVRGCPAHLYQMVLNLALNALDAMPSGGTLTLRVEGQGGTVTVSVADTGAGIAADVGRRVFEPFYTTKEPGRGTGLGLTVTYGIVQEHGGTIDYVSRPGVGTVFTIAIPIATGAEHSASDSVVLNRE